jgi:hypothetical protein
MQCSLLPINLFSFNFPTHLYLHLSLSILFTCIASCYISLKNLLFWDHQTRFFFVSLSMYLAIHLYLQGITILCLPCKFPSFLVLCLRFFKLVRYCKLPTNEKYNYNIVVYFSYYHSILLLSYHIILGGVWLGC